MSWIFEKDHYCCNKDGLKVCVSPMGGRLLQCTKNEFNYLETKAAQTGSTFWTAPQSAWEWPPLPEHDELPYHVYATADDLIMCGKADSKLGFSIAKKYTLKEGKLIVEYQIHNWSSMVQKVAPWEITRVPAGGITSFRGAQRDLFRGELPLQREGERDFFEHKGEHDLKVFAASRTGMIEHEYGNGRILRKEFPKATMQEAAEGEAPIEIYAAKTYVEVEQQGKCQELAQGEFLSWKVVWSFL